MGAIFALGIGGLFVARDRRWSAAKIMLEVQGLMLLLILAAGLRSHADLRFSKALPTTLVCGLGATLVAGAVLYIRMNRRERAILTPGLTWLSTSACVAIVSVTPRERPSIVVRARAIPEGRDITGTCDQEGAICTQIAPR